MNHEKFEQKLKEEYDKHSLFAFLKEKGKGNSEDIKVIKSEPMMLNSFNYVLKHPDTDLEKYYIKEMVNLLLQNEIRVLLPFLEKYNEEMVDEAGKVVIGRIKTSQAKFFYYWIDEPLCFDLSKIYVDDSELLLSDYSNLNFDQGYDTELCSFMMIGGSK
jgi:hypothetical protein